MKKTILVGALIAAISSVSGVGAYAQTGQGNAQTKGMNEDKAGMSKDGMKTDGMAKDGMAKDGMSKDMSKDGSPKADTMKKGN